MQKSSAEQLGMILTNCPIFFLNDTLQLLRSTYILISKENEMSDLSTSCASLQTIEKITKSVN